MPRIARAIAVDYPHYVTQRGNYLYPVFDDDNDFKQYLCYLEDDIEDWRAYLREMEDQVSQKASVRTQ